MRKFYTKKIVDYVTTKLKSVIDFDKIPLPDEFLKQKIKILLTRLN